MVRLALFALTTTMAASCAHKKKPYEAVPIPQEISPGDTLILLRPLEVADGNNTIYFQRGAVVKKNAIYANAPYCWLEFNRPAQAKHTIQPQKFEVTNVTYDVHAQGKQANAQVSTTYFTLRAGKSGETDHIACRWPGEMARPNFLTPEEINSVLDGYFSIEVAN
jgi:hypothetical protein